MSHDTPLWLQQGKEHVWYPYTQMQSAPSPIPIVGAEGCRLTLADGTTLIDGISSWWSTCHGYQHPHLVQAIEKQVKQLSHVMFAGTAHEQAYRLCERLSTLTGLPKVFLTDSGSTAIETAMKMAVQYWRNQGNKRRSKFISFRSGYHGDTMGCMSLCDPHSGMHRQFHDYMPKQYVLDIPRDEYSLSEFETLVADISPSIAGMVIEPLVQGAGGMKFHTADVVEELYRIAKQNNILFIADEVMTGFGRTGNMFACNEAAITPDILCLGKSLTGGMMTLAATLASQKVYDAFLGDELEKALMCGPTFMANPLGCAAANASLDLFEQENYRNKIEAIETQLYKELKPCERYDAVKSVRVKGAIGVVQLADSNWEKMFALRQHFKNQGVWIRPFADVIYLMPSFVISEEELTTLTSKICESF